MARSLEGRIFCLSTQSAVSVNETLSFLEPVVVPLGPLLEEHIVTKICQAIQAMKGATDER